MNSLEFANRPHQESRARNMGVKVMNALGTALELLDTAASVVWSRIDGQALRHERDVRLVHDFAVLPLEQQEHRLAQQNSTDTDLLFYRRTPST